MTIVNQRFFARKNPGREESICPGMPKKHNIHRRKIDNIYLPAVTKAFVFESVLDKLFDSFICLYLLYSVSSINNFLEIPL